MRPMISDYIKQLITLPVITLDSIFCNKEGCKAKIKCILKKILQITDMSLV